MLRTEFKIVAKLLFDVRKLPAIVACSSEVISDFTRFGTCSQSVLTTVGEVGASTVELSLRQIMISFRLHWTLLALTAGCLQRRSSQTLRSRTW